MMIMKGQSTRGVDAVTEILRYKDSWVKFQDCIEGMKELPDKSIDLGITDPPYNIDFKGLRGGCGKPNFNGKVHFDDNIDSNEYIHFTQEWFTQLERITKWQIITPGRMNLKLWYSLFDPTDLMIWYKKNGAYGGRFSLYNKIEPILIFGKTGTYYLDNHFEFISKWGWLAKNDLQFIHPSIKSIELWYDLIKGLQPSSVLDPFMGSGTTLEACIQLGIEKCYGFELEPAYRVDMEKRIERSKYYKKPRLLEEWMEVDDLELQE